MRTAPVPARIPTGTAVALGAVALSAPGLTDLQETTPLVWVMVIASVIGAAITWGFLAYALWKFRDPATRGRKYG